LPERRFGTVPPDVQARIDAAPVAQLDRWLDAASPDAVSGADGRA